MEKLKNWFFDRIPNTLTSGETLCGLPLMEVVNARRLMIENHQCISSYESNEIDVCVKKGFIRILGEDLFLSYMSRDRLIITGRINAIYFDNGGNT